MQDTKSAVIGRLGAIIATLTIMPMVHSCLEGPTIGNNNYYQPQGSQGYPEHYQDQHYQDKYGFSYCQIHPVADGC